MGISDTPKWEQIFLSRNNYRRGEIYHKYKYERTE